MIKTEYVINKRNLKQACIECRVIKFNQNVWLKSYIEMNPELRKKTENDF